MNEGNPIPVFGGITILYGRPYRPQPEKLALPPAVKGFSQLIDSDIDKEDMHSDLTVGQDHCEMERAQIKRSTLPSLSPLLGLAPISPQ